MDAIYWVALANALVWLGLGLYISILHSRQRELARRMAQLEAMRDG